MVLNNLHSAGWSGGQRRWILLLVTVTVVGLPLFVWTRVLNARVSNSMCGVGGTLFSRPQSMEDIACPLNTKYLNDFVANYTQHRDDIRNRLVRARNMWRDGNAKTYVQHIHKGGGSTMCAFLASLPQLGVKAQNNCNGPREFFHITASNFKSIEEHMDSRKERFVFNERSMASAASPEAADARKHFILLTSVRHPLDRIISHMSHVYELSIENKKNVDELVLWLKRFLSDTKPQGARLSEEKEEFHHHENNFESMVFLGRFHQQTSKVPVSAMNALHALDAFDIVIPTDQMSDGLQVIRSMFAPSPLEKRKPEGKRANARQSSDILSEAMRTRDDLRELHLEILSENCADLALYQRAQVVFKMTIEVMEELEWI